MIYCDTSLLVSALTEESASIFAVEWLDHQPAGTLAISGWTLTEFASAIAMKRLRRDIDDREAALISQGWLTLQSKLRMVAVIDQAFAKATSLIDTPPRGLRAGDALHLAIVLDQGCDLATLDRDLADAARALGVAVHPATP